MIEFLSNRDNDWVWYALQSTLVIAGFYFIRRQLRLTSDQNSISHLNFFREVWNSQPLLRARLSVVEFSNDEKVDFEAHEDILATFMEDLAAVVRVGQVNNEHVWSYFSYYVEGYWMIINQKVRFYQEKTSDETYFKGFERMYKLMCEHNTKRGGKNMGPDYQQEFRKEEARVVRFLLEDGQESSAGRIKGRYIRKGS